jgi:ATP-dependent Lon protease
MTRKWNQSPGSEAVELPADLPIIPLLSTIVFPGMIVNLQVSRQKNLRLVEEIQPEDLIGLAVQTDLSVSDPGPAHLGVIGVAARVINKAQVPGNSYQLILQGLRRFQIVEWGQTEPYLRARVRDAEGDFVTSLAANVLVSSAISLFEELAQLDSGISKEAVSLIKMNMDGPGQLADQIATRLVLKLEDKREILEAIEPEERLRAVVRILRRETQVKRIGVDIQRQTQDEIGRAQREYFLRQQLKTIKKELGETSGASGEGKDLREVVETADLPEDVRREAMAELGRLDIMSPASAEYGVIRSYLETVIDLPWKKETVDSVDLHTAAGILDEDHYGLERIKERIVEFLAVRKINPSLKGPLLCLVGPPGTGKTSLGRSIARATGRKFVRVSVGGLRDEAEIRGHRRTYVGAMPGKIVQALRRCGSRNPVFVIDEMDKIGSDFRGDPASALLEVLDPEQNEAYRDLYLDLPFDLSKVFFIATANRVDTIPAALRDRLEILEIPGYTEEEKLEIGRKYLVPRQREAAALDEHAVTFSEEGLRTILREHTRDAGVRGLERHIASVCRKVAKARALGDETPVSIGAPEIRSYVGAPQFWPEMAGRTDEVGVATGLAWTPAGGEILFVEAGRAEGSGQFKLTGQLGDVMKESAEAALSYIRFHASDLGISERVLRESDLHIHVPSGAIPKDGPSAGVALLASLTSILTGRPVRHDTAMTGELTLRGRVLPVGGVREKLLAARRAGVRTVILPLWNRKDLVDVPEAVQRDLSLIFVESVEDVLASVLQSPVDAGVFIAPPESILPSAGHPERQSETGKRAPRPGAGH